MLQRYSVVPLLNPPYSILNHSEARLLMSATEFLLVPCYAWGRSSCPYLK